MPTPSDRARSAQHPKHEPHNSHGHDATTGQGCKLDKGKRCEYSDRNRRQHRRARVIEHELDFIFRL